MAVSAQSDMDDFFAGYSGQQGFQTIIYGKRMLDMMKEDASSDVRALLNRISTIRIISHEEPLNGIIYSARRSVNQSQQYEIISQINENLWEGRYSPIWPDGKKHPRNIYAHSLEECESKLAEMIEEVKAEIAQEKERLKQIKKSTSS